MSKDLSNLMIHFLADMKHGKHTKTQLNKILEYQSLSKKNKQINQLFKLFNSEIKRMVGGDDGKNEFKWEDLVESSNSSLPYTMTNLKNQIDYVNALPKEDKLSIITYTGIGYFLNEPLRKLFDLDEEQQELFDSLTKIFKEAPVLEKPITLYRGQKESTFDSRGFTSTSVNVEQAKKFAGGGCCLYILNVQPGVKVLPTLYTSLAGKEAEVLINRGVKLEHVDTTTVIQELLPGMYLPTKTYFYDVFPAESI
jgi:hypothetical protein